MVCCMAYQRRRCRKGVDSVLDCYPKLVAIDEQADHQVVHGRRFGKANGTTHETLDPCPQIDMLVLSHSCFFESFGVCKSLNS